MCTAYQDCLKLHKLTVFTADVAKRQWYYIQQAARKPQGATVCQHVSCMGVLNYYVKYLEGRAHGCTNDKEGNIPFSKTDLAAIVLVFIPMTW